MRAIFFIFILSGFVSCSNNNSLLNLQALAPKVNLVGFQLIEMGLSKQIYRLKLNIKNPNSFALPIHNLNYQLFINNKSFAKGLSHKSIVIPASGEGYLETDVSSNLITFIEGWQQWISLAKRTLNYRIIGDITVTSFAIPFPFQYSDEINLELNN